MIVDLYLALHLETSMMVEVRQRRRYHYVRSKKPHLEHTLICTDDQPCEDTGPRKVKVIDMWFGVPFEERWSWVQEVIR